MFVYRVYIFWYICIYVQAPRSGEPIVLQYASVNDLRVSETGIRGFSISASVSLCLLHSTPPRVPGTTFWPELIQFFACVPTVAAHFGFCTRLRAVCVTNIN